jgi:hypothetical protein
MDENAARKLRVMRFWIIGILVIIIAGMLAVGFVIPGGLMSQPYYWLAMVAAIVLGAVLYFVYRAVLLKK